MITGTQKAANVTYRLLRGSLRHKSDEEEKPYSIPHIRAVADAVRGKKRRRVGNARVLSNWFGAPYLDSVHVDPEWQGKGISKELLRRLMDKVDQEFEGQPVQTRAVPYDNKPLTRKQLMRLYARFGFKPTGKKGIRLPGRDEEGYLAYRTGTGPGALIREPKKK